MGKRPILGFLWLKMDFWQSLFSNELRKFTHMIDTISDKQIPFWIVLAACLSLYMELMVIRLHASYFQLFGYFKNISLLSCFLGLGIGYAKGTSEKPLRTPLVLPFFSLQIGCMYAIRQFFPGINALLQNPISEQVAFGIEQASQIRHIVLTYGFLSIIFVSNALCFIPVGRLVSRLMLRRPKLISYSWNLVGSLLGILLFYVLAFAWTPAYIWILVAAFMLLVFFYKHILSLISSTVAVTILVIFLNMSFLAPHAENVIYTSDLYSPYQMLTLKVQKNDPPILEVNNVYYQRIIGTNTWFGHYKLPYHFKPDPEDVLIVGSGAGNDVASAIYHRALKIDAVEIDPAILEFGKSLHPAKPYQAAHVNAIVNDARAFIRHTNKQYDLIIYGLLDSHTLLSSMSSVRLDSFVYTVEAFREARTRLKDGGVISITFSLLNLELGRKIFLMLQEAFEGQIPRVYKTVYDDGYTFIIGERLDKPPLGSLHKFQDVTALFEDQHIQVDISTDDWPFLYMPVRKYPISYIIMFIILLAISLLFIRQFIPEIKSSFSPSCFFLGAGFMLIETKGITELALVYGSTWIIIGAVITAILLMAFGANLLVIKIGAPRPVTTYGLLCASLILGFCLSVSPLNTSSLWLNRIVMTILLTLPLFFSGFAFSSELQRSASVAVALSSNLLGAMFGGLLEYNSMYFGFRALYILALSMYGLAFVKKS